MVAAQTHITNDKMAALEAATVSRTLIGGDWFEFMIAD